VEVLAAQHVPTLVVGSGFPAPATARGAAKAYATSAWNPANLPRHAASVLRYEEAASGVTAPWLKFNMCMSATCWQVRERARGARMGTSCFTSPAAPEASLLGKVHGGLFLDTGRMHLRPRS
jgi:hypothetical protein